MCANVSVATRVPPKCVRAVRIPERGTFPSTPSRVHGADFRDDAMRTRERVHVSAFVCRQQTQCLCGGVRVVGWV